MGRFQTLIIEDFKSYKGKHVIGPFDDFTCIIGPNGSGKSNMMDAISFVLGVQSKHLRSSHLKELIYKKDSLSKPAGRASVTLVYKVSSNELEDFNGRQEIIFSRSISQIGISTYKLDRKDVTYELYDEALQKLGLLVKARNFLVFQGDVESVASKSPADLTTLIEQISGSEQYRQEYTNLMKLKETSEESILFLMQKKKMFAGQCKEAKTQKDEADLFQKKKNELNDLKTEHAIWQIWRIVTSKNAHISRLKELQTNLDASKEQEQKKDAEIQVIKKNLAVVSKSLNSLEKELSSKSKKLSNITPELESLRSKMKSLKRRLSELELSSQHLENDQQEQLSNIAKFQLEIKKLEKAEKDIKVGFDTEEGSGALHLDAKKVAEYSRLREEVSARTATQITEERTVEQEMASKKLHIQGLESQMQSLRHEINVTDKQIIDYTDRIERLRRVIIVGENEGISLGKEREDLRKTMSTNQTRLIELETESDELMNKLREAGDERKRGKQDERMFEAVETMKRIFTGVHGKLVDLCRPIQKKYSQAISVAAGGNMDAIVVDSKQIAAECIKYLKDQRIGSCVFLPLNNLSVNLPPDRLRNLGNKYKLCIDLIEYDEKFKPALLYAVGSTMVCDSLEDAQDLCFQRNEQVRAVTLRGYVISRNGAMTGGMPTSKEGQDRWEEKDIERLRKRKIEVDELISNVKNIIPSRQQLLDIENKMKMVQTKLQFSTADENVAKEKLDRLMQQKSLKANTLNDLESSIDAQRSAVTTLEKRLKTLHDVVRQVENEIFASFSASVGVQNIREYEENRLKIYQENITKRKELSERKATIVAQLEYEKKRDFDSALERTKNQLTETQNTLDSCVEEEAALVKQEQTHRQQIDKLKSQVDSKTSEKNKIVDEFKVAQGSKTTILGERDFTTKKISGEEILIEKSRSQLHEILQKARIEEIALPTIEIEGDTASEASENVESELLWTGTRFSTKESRSRARGGESETDESIHFSMGDNAAVLRDQAKAAKIDLSSMNKYKDHSKLELEKEEEQILHQINVVSIDLESMQPNMHAGERYQNLHDKLRDCSTELENARETSRDISTRYEEIKNSRQKLFHECYRHVSEALSVIYKDLTRSSRHPLGGNAYLTLDNTDEPYNGGIRFTAMPPMKRFRDMDQLSGGEKTIAALALLFSIHSFRQAPFFVLDEVDAALDNVNVRKVCNYIQQRSKDFQCIVISLKDFFFENADSLIGICKDVRTLSSRILTLDLKKYEDSQINGKGGFSEVSVSSDHHRAHQTQGTPSDLSRSTSSSALISPQSSRSGKDRSAGRKRHLTEVEDSRSAVGTSLITAIAEEDEEEEQ